MHEQRCAQHAISPRLAKLGIDFPFFLAPMVGISHVAMRELVRSYLPPGISLTTYTEMLSTRRLPSERLESVNELRISPGEPAFIPQILGNEERFIEPSIHKLMQLKPWGFDINMGCPSRHILNHNWGVRLMGDPAYAAAVVAMTVRHSPVPVTVKLRAGLDGDINVAFLDTFTGALEDAGAAFLSIHARTQSQRHGGPADWLVAREIARRRKIPVVVNGDIQTAHDAIKVVRELGCDGAMVARAATARPWIFWQIAYHLGMTALRPPLTLSEESREFFRASLRMIDLLGLYFADQAYAIRKFQFFAATGARWFAFGHVFWKSTLKSKTLDHLRSAVEEYGARHEHQMYERIDLH